MFTFCQIKNISGIVKALHAHEFQADEVFIIPDDKRDGWANNDDVISAITDGDFEIHDSSGAVSGLANQVSWLQNYIPQVSEIEKMPPFAEPLYRTKNDATDGITTCPINTVTTINYALPYERYVSGGVMLVKNAEFGDYISADIHDTDSVIPEAYRAALCEAWPIVATYINKQFVKTKGGVYTLHEIDTRPLNAKITAGLYLRVSYHAINAGSNREAAINYDLQNKL